jgi:hypothetical protein
VNGEVVDALQSLVGLKAEGNVTYVDGEDSKWIEFLDKFPGAAAELSEGYLRIRSHFMEAVLKALDCFKEGEL